VLILIAGLIFPTKRLTFVEQKVIGNRPPTVLVLVLPDSFHQTRYNVMYGYTIHATTYNN